MPWLKKGINKFIPSVIWQPNPPLNETIRLFKGKHIILDLGAGGRVISDAIFGVDFIAFNNTKLVCDVHALAISDHSVDGIICTGTLEHVSDPHLVISEIYRILKGDGIIHLEVPFMQPYHRDPEDYWRWTPSGLCLFVQQHGFEVIKSGSHLRTQSAMNAIIISYFQSWFTNQYIRKGFDVFLSWFLWIFKFLDRFAKPETFDIPSGVYVVAIKHFKNL